MTTKTAIQRINLLIDMFETLENTFVVYQLKEIKNELETIKTK